MHFIYTNNQLLKTLNKKSPCANWKKRVQAIEGEYVESFLGNHS